MVGIGNQYFGDLYQRHDELYSSWARFLASTRTTVQEFCFNESVNRKQFCASRPLPITEHWAVGRLFSHWILPILLEVSWPHMKHVELKGVETFILTDHGFKLNHTNEVGQFGLDVDYVLTKLRDMFKDGAELIWEE
ncbi:hypothetical protein BKA66DRAFT_442558 [Pyrenochaeta sp. MPI-SDFR-AT-0127]|nr:hypothetical protein BKA66DRAFT_442558 [Pyrenochaeta sp. MPI-SDFR-AT-0127]